MHEACKEYANNRFPCTSSSSKHSAMAPRHRGRAVTSLSRLNVAIGSFISRWTVIPEERARVECIANPKDCGTEEPGCQTLLMGGNKLPEARGRDRHCVQPDVVSSAVRGLLSVPQASRLQVARLGRARSAASARRQVSICRRNRGAAWHWRQAPQWRRRCDEGKSIGDAGAGRSLKSSESRIRSVPEGKKQGQRHRQTPLSGRDKRQKARVMSILKRRGYCQHSGGVGIQCV